MPASLVGDEIGAAFGGFFFGGDGPSHSTLTRVFSAAGYSSDDPYDVSTGTPNKENRVLVVFAAARRRPARARDLVDGLLVQFRRHRYFDDDSADSVKWNVKALRAALRRAGWNLTEDGELVSLGQIELTTGGRPALEEQIARIKRSSEDPGALIGSAKDLLESVAKFVLEEVGMPVTSKMDFPALLHLARERLDLLPRDVDTSLAGGEAIRKILQASYQIADQVNALRHVQGVGHGRTLPTGVTPEMALLVVREATSVAEFMLTTLYRKYGS
jgi:hypothetical protein